MEEPVITVHLLEQPRVVEFGDYSLCGLDLTGYLGRSNSYITVEEYLKYPDLGKNATNKYCEECINHKALTLMELAQMDI